MFEQIETKLQTHDANIEYLMKSVKELQNKANPPQKLTYTVKEAVNATGLKVGTIRKYINDKVLKAVKTGKNHLIEAESLLNLLKTNA